MFGKLMNRYFYGKSGQGDFEKEDLPQTRWQLFWEMLRVRFSGLMRLNLMYVIVWLPAIFFIGRVLLYGYSGLVNLSEYQSQMEAGSIAAEAYQEYFAQFQDAMRSLLFSTLVFLIPCIGITGPATAGLCYVTRNWARDEHAFIWSDYKDAIKANWKPALLNSFITGLVPVMLYVCCTFYGSMAQSQSAVFLLPQVICIMLGVLWLMMQMYIYPQIVTYDLNYKGVIRNGLLMAIGRLPMTVGLNLLALVPTLIFLAVSLLTPYFQYAVMIYALYYILIGFSLHRFICASYTNGVFDKLINSKIEGVQVGRGLYVEEEDNGEDQSEEDAAEDSAALPDDASAPSSENKAESAND